MMTTRQIPPTSDFWATRRVVLWRSRSGRSGNPVALECSIEHERIGRFGTLRAHLLGSPETGDWDYGLRQDAVPIGY